MRELLKRLAKLTHDIALSDNKGEKKRLLDEYYGALLRLTVLFEGMETKKKELTERCVSASLEAAKYKRAITEFINEIDNILKKEIDHGSDRPDQQADE